MGSCENLGRVYCDKPELLIPSVPECCSLRATGLRAKKTEMSADSTGRYYVCSSFSLTYRFSWATHRTAHRSKDRVNFIVGSHSENWFNIFDQRDIAGNLSRLQLNDIRTQTLNFSASGGTGCALRLTNTATLTPHKYEDEDHFAVFFLLLSGRTTRRSSRHLVPSLKGCRSSSSPHSSVLSFPHFHYIIMANVPFNPLPARRLSGGLAPLNFLLILMHFPPSSLTQD